MKAIRITVAVLLFSALGAAVWVMLFHADWVKPSHESVEEKEPETEVPIHVGKVVKATLHRYTDCFGTVMPEMRRAGTTPASARIASPVAGVILEVACVEGQRVEKGAVLFKLDDRIARAEEAKAEA